MEAGQVSHSLDISPEVAELILQSNFAEAERVGDSFFQEGKFLQAVAVYKKVVEAGYIVNFQIEGLGNFDHTVYRYEWWIYRWYNDQRKQGKFRGNVFDALSLCYCQIRDTNPEELEKGILWYEDMLGERQRYELYVGYANILSNSYRYDQALKVYNKVIQQQPNLINVYVSICFLHEFKRVQKPKSIDMAQRILEKDPQNMYALFVLGKNQKDVDERIKKLKQAAYKHPEYVRLVNEVGLSHGAKKEHKEAIEWYKKCIQIAPQYAQGCNNVAYRTQQLGEYGEALTWYFRAVQIDPKYKMAYSNAIKIFEKLNFTDDDIIQEMSKYININVFHFYYYLGLAYFDKPKIDVALTWYQRAEALDSKNYQLFNSMGLAYENKKDYVNGERYYFKSIELNPKYKYPTYNLGLLYKHQNQIEKAIDWYKKAIEVDSRYHPPYNNLGNIYRDRQQYEKAIDCYRKCVSVNSTYTLAFANMAICYLNQEMYPDAFNAFSRAKQILPTDNNGLTQSNKKFLKENLEKFDKEGEKWRKTGSIGEDQKEFLRSLIREFESNFKQLYSSKVVAKVSDQKALRPEILQIVNLIYEDQFKLLNINKVFSLVKQLFHQNEEYFHIIPQLFIQYFWNNVFKLGREIQEIESELFYMIKDISSKELIEKEGNQQNNLGIKLKNFNPPGELKVNLFKDKAYFNNFEVLYSEIDKANKFAQKSLAEFIELVEAVQKRANGIPSGVGMKLPKQADQQFRVIMHILQKIFKQEINDARMNSIISHIDERLRSVKKSITLINIVHEITEAWTQEITQILQERFKSETETTCDITDLVKGKIAFNNADDLLKAVQACDKICHLRGYEILHLSSRKQLMEAVLKIKMNQSVCELQLVLKQDEEKRNFINTILEIQRSPLGSIFGSYFFMSKGFSYPFLANCQDIAARLKASNSQTDQRTVIAAQFIIKALQEKNEP